MGKSFHIIQVLIHWYRNTSGMEMLRLGRRPYGQVKLSLSMDWCQACTVAYSVSARDVIQIKSAAEKTPATCYYDQGPLIGQSLFSSSMANPYITVILFLLQSYFWLKKNKKTNPFRTPFKYQQISLTACILKRSTPLPRLYCLYLTCL